MATSPSTTPQAPWNLLMVLAGNMLIDALEVSLALVALPTISRDLDLSTTSAQWLVTGFAAGFGGLLLFGGRLVALFGRRRVYLVALVVFALASLTGALTDSVGVLVATRFVKGACAALTAPTGMAVITSAFPEGAPRRRAVSVYTLFGACGFSAGLLLSGALTEIGWRWTFAFPGPAALLLFAAAKRLLPRDEPLGDEPRQWDAAGAIGLCSATLLLVYALASGPGSGWSSPATLGALALAALAAAAFVRAELTSPRPLLQLALLRHGPLLRSALGAAALNGSYLGLLFLTTLQLQRQAGWSPWATGLAFLPSSLPLALTALYSGRLVARWGAPRMVAAGAAAAVLGDLLYPRGGDVRYATDILPTMLLVGTAFVLTFTALHLQATGSLAAESRPAASGLYQTSVQLGAALTVALTAALSTGGRGPALLLITGVGTVGLLVALSGLRGRRTVPA